MATLEQLAFLTRGLGDVDDEEDAMDDEEESARSRVLPVATRNSFFNVRMTMFFSCSSSRSKTMSRFRSQSGVAVKLLSRACSWSGRSSYFRKKGLIRINRLPRYRRRNLLGAFEGLPIWI